MAYSEPLAVESIFRVAWPHVYVLLEMAHVACMFCDWDTAVFQAAIIARKKEAAAETLRAVREELAQAEAEVQEKRDLAKQGDGEEVLKGEEVSSSCLYVCVNVHVWIWERDDTNISCRCFMLMFWSTPVILLFINLYFAYS